MKRGVAPKKGVITSKNMGKVYFAKWSMDVILEGENVVRHLDLTTHNHGSNTNTATWPHVASQALAGFGDDCKDAKTAIEDNCAKDGSDQCPGALSVAPDQQKQFVGKLQKKPGNAPSKDTLASMKDHALKQGEKGLGRTTVAARMASEDAASQPKKCVEAMRCFLRPKSPKATEVGCCPGQTPNHIPPVSFLTPHHDGFGDNEAKYNAALCVCLEGTNQHGGTHGDNHALIDFYAENHDLNPPPAAGAKGKRPQPITLKEKDSPTLEDAIAVSAKATHDQTNCGEKCIEAQLNEHFKSKLDLPPKTSDVTYDKIAGRDAIDQAAKKRNTNR